MRARGRHAPLVRLVGARLLGGVFTLLAVSVLVFAATELAPGDAATAIVGASGDRARIEVLRAELGLNRPAPLRYLGWLGGALRGDLGVSFANGRPVREIIASRAGNSAFLGLVAVALLLPLALALGVMAGLREGGVLDRLLIMVTLVLVSIPEFVTGTLLVLLFAVRLGWLPAVSLLAAGEAPWQRPMVLVLPVATLLAVCLAQNVRLVRAGVVEAARADATEVARLNGVPESRVILRWIVPAALVPALPILARYVAYLLGGTLIAETLFGYPGLASVLVGASAGRDAPVVLAVALLAAALTVGLNLVADLLGLLLDPRQREVAR